MSDCVIRLRTTVYGILFTAKSSGYVKRIRCMISKEDKNEASFTTFSGGA